MLIIQPVEIAGFSSYIGSINLHKGMKLVLLYIILSIPFIVFAQDEEKLYTPPDSIKLSLPQEINPPVEVKPLFFVPLKAVNSFPLSLRIGLNTFSPMYEDNSVLNTNLLYPTMPFEQGNKLSFIYSMLGAVQTGAVGYLAYKHIKKYGFLK